MFVAIDKLLLRLPDPSWCLNQVIPSSCTALRSGLTQDDYSELIAIRKSSDGPLRSLFFGVPLDQQVPIIKKGEKSSAQVCEEYPNSFGDCLTDNFKTVSKNFQEKFDILLKLFPSRNMPSDHPAIGVHFILNE
jgi:hypothetical protein